MFNKPLGEGGLRELRGERAGCGIRGWALLARGGEPPMTHVVKVGACGDFAAFEANCSHLVSRGSTHLVCVPNPPDEGMGKRHALAAEEIAIGDARIEPE